jgi:hypothetical protein
VHKILAHPTCIEDGDGVVRRHVLPLCVADRAELAAHTSTVLEERRWPDQEHLPDIDPEVRRDAALEAMGTPTQTELPPLRCDERGTKIKMRTVAHVFSEPICR